MLTSLQERKYYPQIPRDYQEKAIDSTLGSWQRTLPALPADSSRPLGVAATGGGKTTIIAETLRRYINPHKQRALVIAHREELIEQLYERIANQFNGQLDQTFGSGGLFGAPGLGIVMAERNQENARIVVGTIQSLHPKRLASALVHGLFDVLVIDEAHHASPGSSYETLIRACKKANPALKILGVTATPSRSDGKALGAIFTHIAFEWTIRDGVDGGFLVPPTRIKVSTDVDLSSVRTQGGDYNQTALNNILKAQNWLELCVDAFKTHVLPRKSQALAFLPNVEMSIQFADALKKEGIAVEHIDANTDKNVRRKIMEDFKAGKIFCVSNVGIATEGFDHPAVGTIFLARPTRSKVLFTQIVGRGVRKFPGKEHCAVVDLSVHDTKVLEVGSLMGKMVHCVECNAEYYHGCKHCPNCGVATGHTIECRKCETYYAASAKACPACGEATPKPKRDIDEDEKEQQAINAGSFIGTGLMASHASLFEDSKSAWFSDDPKYMSCSVGDEGILMIIPPTVDPYYRLCLIPKSKTQSISVLGRNEDLTSLVAEADREAHVRATALTAKDAGWRDRRPSESQLNFLRSLGGKPPEGANMGVISMMISHFEAKKRIRQFTITPATTMTPDLVF